MEDSAYARPDPLPLSRKERGEDLFGKDTDRDRD
jgi:hypothetical protein